MLASLGLIGLACNLAVGVRQRYGSSPSTDTYVTLSLNARFDSAAAPDDPHPPGAGIASALEAALRARGFAVDSFANWRDTGWVIGLGSRSDALDITLAA